MLAHPNIIFVFLDGIGLGDADRHINPFTTRTLASFERLAAGQQWTREMAFLNDEDHVFRPLDATLGVSGLPQSGTGQASLFTGINCADLASRHFGPFPHSSSKPILASDNLFKKVNHLSKTNHDQAAFANAYPPRFFDYAKERDRWTVTTRCCLEAGILIRSNEHLSRGEAISADLTGQRWPDRDSLDLQPISEYEAGKRLLNLGKQHAVTLFEYYLTDKAGHQQSSERAEAVLLALDRFLEGLLEQFDPTRHLLLITSDHGNLENLSTKSHTFNDVPLVAYGKGAHHFKQCTSILDVTPTLIQALSPS